MVGEGGRKSISIKEARLCSQKRGSLLVPLWRCPPCAVHQKTEGRARGGWDMSRHSEAEEYCTCRGKSSAQTGVNTFDWGSVSQAKPVACFECQARCLSNPS